MVFTRTARQALKWLGLGVAMVLGLIAVLCIAIALTDPNRLRGRVARLAAGGSGREIRIDGAMHAHLWSWTPELSAERVTVGNPSWTPPGVNAEIGRISLAVDLRALLSGRLLFERVKLQSVSLHLIRDAAGLANWQWVDPRIRRGKGLPLMHSLSLENARVTLQDDRRHLKFDGVVSARDLPGPVRPAPLRIDAAGQLNGRAVTFAVNADPLALVRRNRRYRFAFLERSSGTTVRGSGSLPRPFDVLWLETTYDAQGEDLRDLYFLTGLGLFDTGRYRLTGKLVREGNHFEFGDLVARSGASDVHGELSVESAVAHRAQVSATLSSQRMRMADLGLRAAGRAGEPTGLLPARPLPIAGLRASEWSLSYRARTLEWGRLMLSALEGHARLDHGVLNISPLSAELQNGRIHARLRLDAARQLPAAQLDGRIVDLPLDQFGHKPGHDPLVDGVLEAHIDLSGRGRSLREIGASAQGTVTAVLPHGQIRAALADLAGLDLQRGLGLALSKDRKDTGLRCAVASFDIHEGSATARTLIVDTQPTVITGQGTVRLDSGALDFTVRGHPKHVSLMRVRSPLLIGGTVLHPAFRIAPRSALAQAGAAVALGVVLTPVAAALAFVDPGLASDANCTGLMEDARDKGVPVAGTASR